MHPGTRSGDERARYSLAEQPTAWAWRSLAVLARTDGDAALAIRRYRSAVELREDLAPLRLELLDALLAAGDGEQALAVIDATVRLLPGAMSDLDSARTDSFYGRGISAPSYTRPPEFRGHGVPDVLLSGDHKKIEEWRKSEGERLTGRRSKA